MKKTILLLTTIAIFAGPALGITYRKPVTAHQQLTSTGTLTHAALESTLTAVNEATTTLKSISDAHAATLVQVGMGTATLAGLIGSGAGDNLGNHVATTTLNMAYQTITNPKLITSSDTITIQTQFDYYNPLAGGIFLRGSSYGISARGIDISQGGDVTMGITSFPNSATFDGRVNFNSGWINDKLPFGLNSAADPTILLVRDGGYGIFTGSVTSSGGFYGDHYGGGSNLTGITAGQIVSGTFADGVKVTTANVTASGTPDATTFLRGDGAWATPSGSGDMVQATHGVAIGASTATLRTDVTALQASTATLRSDVGVLQTATATIAGQIAILQASTATLRSDITAIQSTLTSIGTSTATLQSAIDAVEESTGTLQADLATEVSDRGLADAAIGVTTATLRTDVNAIKASTGAVGVGAHFIVYGNTQTFVTNLSTQPISQLRSSPLGAFIISSATARIVDGTSATVRLFITAKNSEYNISAATPVWSSAVTAGANHTGGTLSNVTVGVDNALTVVIDAIAGAVKYLDISVWGNR